MAGMSPADTTYQGAIHVPDRSNVYEIKEASVRNLAFAAGLVLALSLVAGPAVLADTTELQDSYISISGPGGSILGASSELSPSGSGTGYSYSSTGFDNGSGFSSSTYGTYTVKLTAAVSGTYKIAGYFDAELTLPYFNEYAAVNGSAASGQSYEVGDPQTSTIVADTLANALTNVNGIPQGTDNEVGKGTNGDVSFAMNFSEVLVAGDVETVTFAITTTNPGGFNIEQVHPVDGENNAQTVAYFAAAESVVAPGCTVNCGPPPPPGMPEPGSLVLLGTALGLLGVAKKFAN